MDSPWSFSHCFQSKDFWVLERLQTVKRHQSPKKCACVSQNRHAEPWITVSGPGGGQPARSWAQPLAAQSADRDGARAEQEGLSLRTLPASLAELWDSCREAAGHSHRDGAGYQQQRPKATAALCCRLHRHQRLCPHDGPSHAALSAGHRNVGIAAF